MYGHLSVSFNQRMTVINCCDVIGLFNRHNKKMLVIHVAVTMLFIHVAELCMPCDMFSTPVIIPVYFVMVVLYCDSC